MHGTESLIQQIDKVRCNLTTVPTDIKSSWNWAK